MQKFSWKKIAVILTSGALAAGAIFSAQAIYNGSPDDRMTDYSIENILSKYNIFIEEDFESINHSVGAVAVGGNYTSVDGWGDAAVVPSYVGKFAGGGGDMHLQSFLADTQWADLKTDVVYTGTESDTEGHQGVWIYNPDFIDWEKASAEIAAQSSGVAAAAVQAHADDSNFTINEWTGEVVYNLDVSQYDSKNIVIPVSILQKLATQMQTPWAPDLPVINITDSSKENGITLEELATEGYTISFTGIGDTPVIMATNRYDSAAIGLWSENKEGYVFALDINNQEIWNDQSFKNLEGTFNSGQVYMKGMNLLYNFPDATGTVRSVDQSGHLVAPHADVSVLGNSNFEGGVIARKMYTDSEAHFYPYNGILPSEPLDTTTASEDTTTATTTTTTATTTTTTATTTTTTATTTTTTATTTTTTPTETTTTTTSATTTTTSATTTTTTAATTTTTSATTTTTTSAATTTTTSATTTTTTSATTTTTTSAATTTTTSATTTTTTSATTTTTTATTTTTTATTSLTTASHSDDHDQHQTQTQPSLSAEESTATEETTEAQPSASVQGNQETTTAGESTTTAVSTDLTQAPGAAQTTTTGAAAPQTGESVPLAILGCLGAFTALGILTRRKNK